MDKEDLRQRASRLEEQTNLLFDQIHGDMDQEQIIAIEAEIEGKMRESTYLHNVLEDMEGQN